MNAPPGRTPNAPAPKAGILEIAPYVGGKARAAGFDEPIKLSSNENALGSSPAARAAFEAAVSKLHLYPDGRASGLRAALAERYGLDPDRLLFGCGSDEIFSLLCQVYCEAGDNVVQGQYGFLAYAIAARAAQAEVRFAPEPDFRLDIDEVLSRVDHRTRVVFVANPSNPTGTWNTTSEIDRLQAALPPRVVLALDGAYAEFADDARFSDGLELARERENVAVFRTFSKIHGLAALRVGWVYAPAAMVNAMDRIRSPFNVNAPAQSAAVAALGDEGFISASRDLVMRWRPWLIERLGRLGLKTMESQTNFVMVRFPNVEGRTADDAEAFLASRGILVRGLRSYGVTDALRVTIGLEGHNRALVDALAAFLGAPPQQ